MRWTYGVSRPSHFCGGSIISRNHIVTAAHCVQDKRTQTRYIKIYTGTSRTDSAVGTPGSVFDVKAIKVHPGYIGAGNTYLDDIAIVTVSLKKKKFFKFKLSLQLFCNAVEQANRVQQHSEGDQPSEQRAPKWGECRCQWMGNREAEFTTNSGQFAKNNHQNPDQHPVQTSTSIRFAQHSSLCHSATRNRRLLCKL